MTKSIIYPHPSGGVSLLTPILECGIPLEEIARKDVPAGVPYKIIDNSDVPPDLIYQSAWEFDFTESDGYGVGAEAWFAEQEGKK